MVSFDYTYRDFRNVRYNEGDPILQDANRIFSIDFRAIHAFNLGTEWIFDRLSLRGGYFYEKNPNLREGGDTNTDNLRGFTVGLGYNFGNTQVELSYLKSESDEFYSLYNLEDIDVNNNTFRISAGLTFYL